MTTADDATAWPPLPEMGANDPQAEVKKLLYQAQVQLALARQQAADEAGKAAWGAEYTHRQTVDNAYLDVTKSAIDRAQARAQFIQTAAASIATAYAAILALSFKADGTSPNLKPLPAQGVIPPLFLGLAIVFVTVYLGYLGRHPDVAGPAAGSSLVEDQAHRLNAFTEWSAAQITPRAYFLHASIVSLALGVGLLPLAYLQIPVLAVLAVALAGVVVVLAVPAILRGAS